MMRQARWMASAALMGSLVVNQAAAADVPNAPVAPDIVPGWKAMGAQSVVVRSDTPLAIRQKLSTEVGRILALPDA